MKFVSVQINSISKMLLIVLNLLLTQNVHLITPKPESFTLS